MLKIADIHKLRMACLANRLLTSNCFRELFTNINFHTNNHDHNSHHATELVLSFPSVNNIRMNFKYQIVNIWNSVPNNIQLIDNCNEFK